MIFSWPFPLQEFYTGVKMIGGDVHIHVLRFSTKKRRQREQWIGERMWTKPRPTNMGGRAGFVVQTSLVGPENRHLHSIN